MSEALRLELDGPEASPTEVDSRALFELGAAFLAALEEIAKARGKHLEHRGVVVVDKCIELQVQSNDLKEAWATCLELNRISIGAAPTPPRTKTHVHRWQKVLRDQERAKRAVRVHAGTSSFQLKVKKQEPPDTPWAVSTLRLYVVEVGGVEPHVKVSSESESDVFELDASKADCLKLREFLYGNVDVTVRLLRDNEGAIERGEVIEVHELADRPDPSKFVEWVKKAGEHWQGVNWKKELGRGD